MPDTSSVSPKKIALVALTVVALGVGLWLISRSTLRGDQLKALTDRRTLIDAETGETFVDMRLPTGAAFPYENPNTGALTLYPAEMCFWNADGTARLEPTYVLLNRYKGEPEPTTCPDCGMRVRAHNPMPPDDLLVEAARAQDGG